MSSNSHPSAAVKAFHRCTRTIIEETKSLDAADKTRTLLSLQAFIGETLEALEVSTNQ
jgi:hypothetical protein